MDHGWRSEAKTLNGTYGCGVLATKPVFDTTGDVWAVPAPLIALLLL